jgi:hypothetical protein
VPAKADEVGSEMQELLAYANYSKIGKALGVGRGAVAEWAKGRNVTPYRVHQVWQLLGGGGRAITEGRENYESEPSWARDLRARLEAIDAKLSGMPDPELWKPLVDLAIDRTLEGTDGVAGSPASRTPAAPEPEGEPTSAGGR